MKILTVVGARPQFIKAAVVSRAFKTYNMTSPKEEITEVIVHTGQHFDENMSKVFFDQLNIPHPDYNLEINSLSHGAMTGRMLEEIEKVLLTENPDWVLVYGDTNSTLAGALAAKKLKIKVAHVEAGLRSFNMDMPEEINRIMTDRISDILFCPTNTAIENLANEGYDNLDITSVYCGDVMNDAAIYYRKNAIKPKEINFDSDFILCTCHRQENTDRKENLISIFDALGEISKSKRIILPLHPRTSKKLQDHHIVPNRNIYIIDPLGYLEMIWLLSHCDMVITDSGGLQKEAFFFSKPCITIREETEWLELVSKGVNFLVGSDYQKILEAFEKLKIASIKFDMDLYGTGNAGDNIVQELVNFSTSRSVTK